jgi:hypothetical protein
VLVRRTVAAQRNAAVLAGAQMNPWRPDLYALFAFEAFRPRDRSDGSKMRTSFVRHN